MPEDPKVEYQENVPQERGQDADLYGEGNKVPDSKDQQFWSGDGDHLRGSTDDASAGSDEAASASGTREHSSGNQATYGSMGQGGVPASGATVDPTRTADSVDQQD